MIHGNFGGRGTEFTTLSRPFVFKHRLVSAPPLIICGWKLKIHGVTEVLEHSFIANPESEQIWLAAVKLEAENGEFGVASELLIRARTRLTPTRLVSISLSNS